MTPNSERLALAVSTSHLSDCTSVVDAFHKNARENPDAPAYCQPNPLTSQSFAAYRNDADSTTVTSYREFQDNILSIASYLEIQGLGRGSRVAILSNTRPEWAEAKLAIDSAAATLVTCYTSDPAERIGFVLHDSQVKTVFVENQEQLNKILKLHREQFTVPETELEPQKKTTLSLNRIIAIEPVQVPEEFAGLVVTRADILKEYVSAPEVRHNYKSMHGSDEATVIYTSGTTGAPKGVVATQAQHLANATQMINSGMIEKSDRVFQLLPLAHGFGLNLYHTLITVGAQAAFPRILSPTSSQLTEEGKKLLLTDMAQSNSGIIPTVPTVLDKIKDGIREKSKLNLLRGIGDGLIRALIIKSVLTAYQEKYRASAEDRSMDFSKRLLLNLLESPLTGRLGVRITETIRKTIVGDEFKYFISGGAPLSEDTANFFWSLEIPVFNGYGSTEANVPVAVNTPKAHRQGSVGRLLDSSLSAKISDKGELLLRGPNIATGYLNRPKATAGTWDAEGWLHTGDSAAIEDGFITINGRIDDTIILSNGKNIIPYPLEERLCKLPFVAHAVVGGQGQESLFALLSLDEQAIREWAAINGREVLIPYYSDPEIKDVLQQQLASMNATTAKKSEKIGAALIIPRLSIGNGLTATFKVQRKKLLTEHQHRIQTSEAIRDTGISRKAA